MILVKQLFQYFYATWQHLLYFGKGEIQDNTCMHYSNVIDVCVYSKSKTVALLTVLDTNVLN